MQRIALNCGKFYRSIPRCVNNSINSYNKSVPRLQYSTNGSSIGSNSLSKREDNTIEPTILQRNVMQLNETRNANQIESIKCFEEQNVIQIQFSDGQTFCYNTIWLRDSCNCEQCVRPLTKSKQINSFDISEDLFVHRFHCFDDIIEIHWKNHRNEEHCSQYNIDWLLMFSDLFSDRPKGQFVVMYPNDGIYAPRVPQTDIVLWDSTHIDKQKLTTNYNEFMSSNDSVKSFLESFNRFGVVFLEGVPIERNAILSVARRMGYERPTSYGTTFNVKISSDPKSHIAYTGDALGLHTDLPYREQTPGVELLHCLTQASVGGSSTLVDGFKCVETLRNQDFECFDILTKNPVLFAFCDKENDIWFRQKWPIITIDDNQKVKEIHYNSHSMRAPLLPLPLLDKFYESHRKLTALIRDERFVYRFNLRAGDLIMINNRRILHGRDEFNRSNQTRHLEGCYMDLDEVMALYEKLNTN